ncbi:MAG: glycosyltransferase family 9 protein [Planctomycetaceae bacterium]|nr:glycosyltransferase family 9 protein [Planctomycetaceae bacterium]
MAAAHLKTISYDLVISLDDEPRACNLASGVTTKNLFGAYWSGRHILYTPDSADWFNMSLISTLGKDEADKRKKANQRSYPEILFDALKIIPGKPSLHLGIEDREFAERFEQSYLEHNSIKIGLNTGAGNRWQFKQLDVSKTVDLANELTRPVGRQILIFGGPEEVERNQEIIRKVSCPIVNTGTNNSIRQFAALVGLCDILVTSDSLALHIASALGVATVSFFGPTSVAEIKLFSRGEKIVSPLSCVCCYKRSCDFSPNCMDGISTDQISLAVQN